MSYILNLNTKMVVLYNPNTTFIDGYDPLTGIGKPAIIPSLLIKKARKNLYSYSSRKGKIRVISMNSIIEESQ